MRFAALAALGRADEVSGGAESTPPRWRHAARVSIGLVYLAFPVMEIVTGEVNGVRAVWAAAGLTVFVACYLAIPLSKKGEGDPTPLICGLLTIVTVLAVGLPVAFGGGWVALPIYTTVAYSMALRPPFSMVGAVAMAAVVLLLGVLKDNELSDTMVLVFQVLTLAVLFMRVRRTRMLVGQLRQARDEVARLAASEERLRIARDLHDLLGHSLSLIVLKSELAGRLAESGSERALPEIRDIESVARQALVEVREAVTGYRQRGLSGELDGARAALEAAGTQVRIRMAGTPLPGDLDGLLGWAVREGVTNVIRHARAASCEIDVRHDGRSAVLEIVDDGCGTAPYGQAAERVGGRPGERGNGLTGLTERVEAVGGTVFAGPRETGFALRVAVPAPGGRP